MVILLSVIAEVPQEGAQELSPAGTPGAHPAAADLPVAAGKRDVSPVQPEGSPAGLPTFRRRQRNPSFHGLGNRPVRKQAPNSSRSLSPRCPRARKSTLAGTPSGPGALALQAGDGVPQTPRVLSEEEEDYAHRRPCPGRMAPQEETVAPTTRFRSSGSMVSVTGVPPRAEPVPSRLKWAPPMDPGRGPAASPPAHSPWRGR
ncbi:hypothetical protein ACJJTC_014064 [Scirpophaga incertulas]